MQVTETLNEGLKRKLSLVIPKKDLSDRLDARLDELKGTANIKGFRPGKVPTAHLKKVYGRSAMSEVLSDAINSTVSEHARRPLRTRCHAAQGRPPAGPGRHQPRAGRRRPTSHFEVSYEVLPAGDPDGYQVVSSRQQARRLDRPTRTSTPRCTASSRRTAATTEKGDDAVVADGDRLGLSPSSARSTARNSPAALPTMRT
jgi:trigger factor